MKNTNRNKTRYLILFLPSKTQINHWRKTGALVLSFVINKNQPHSSIFHFAKTVVSLNHSHRDFYWQHVSWFLALFEYYCWCLVTNYLLQIVKGFIFKVCASSGKKNEREDITSQYTSSNQYTYYFTVHFFDISLKQIDSIKEHSLRCFVLKWSKFAEKVYNWE